MSQSYLFILMNFIPFSFLPMTDLDRLLLGLKQRMKQLEDNVVELEKENSKLYAAMSLRIIELEYAEIQDLVNKLNRTTNDYYHLNVQAAAQLEDMKNTMVELLKFDKMQVIKKNRENQIKKNLEQYKEELKASSPPPTVSPGRCGLGQLVNVAGPRITSPTPYGTSYPYGAWGRDVKPAPGDENKYLLVGADNTVALPSDTGYNSKFPFGHLGTTYSYTDMDFATDELGIYVIYATTSNFGNVIITKVETSNPPVFKKTWFTSLLKTSVTNTFMVCGVLYATRYLDKDTEQIFYSYDTKTKKERYDLKINIKKMKTNIEYLNYDPRDRLLYVYSDAYIVTYELVFQ
ncbi:hypothetical protein cypCar_00038113 [Cyprinus carpio]|nr:hypothetical protein cypCar_00038113 [Cyprinus carpio]